MPEARKLDQGKPRMDLIPPDELLELGALFALGAVKYEDDNWRAGDGLEWKRLYAAAQRHLNLFWAGEDYDQEDGQPHLIAVAFCALTLRWLSKHRRHMDPRVQEDEPEGDSTDADEFDRVKAVRDDIERRQRRHRYLAEGDHGERRQWDRPATIDVTARVTPASWGEAPESPAAVHDPEVEARLPMRVLLGQRGLGALARYVGHQEDCQGFKGEACKCGLDNVIRELRNA